jgi:hypothetical protein
VEHDPAADVSEPPRVSLEALGGSETNALRRQAESLSGPRRSRAVVPNGSIVIDMSSVFSLVTSPPSLTTQTVDFSILSYPIGAPSELCTPSAVAFELVSWQPVLVPVGVHRQQQ